MSNENEFFGGTCHVCGQPSVEPLGGLCHLCMMEERRKKHATTTSDPADPRVRRGPPDEKPRPQNEAYLVLSDEERTKGWVKPYRDSYRHTTCKINPFGVTTMGRKLSETYARDPWFYGSTYCSHCSMHRPLGEFTWMPDGESMDPADWPAEEHQRIADLRAGKSAPPAPSPLAVETAREIRDLVCDTLSTPLNGDTTESFLPKTTALLKSAFAKVRAEERERCAKICDKRIRLMGEREPLADYGAGALSEARCIAAAIREGGSNES